MLKNAIDNLLISISRLIAVDSAGVAIAEIDLREGGILIGGGNIGKTSILNAIRLFLLPEENFKDSKNKFGFADKEGNFYSNDECFEHYFPSSTSFLILECDNYLGGPIPHCQILYRGSSEKLDYRRMFTSLRYEQIRHLFWDDNAGDDGIGGRVDDLTLSKVQAFLKREDKYFKSLVRSSAIKEVIYANQLLDIDAMRFCLFPLSSTKDADVDAFRALVRLLFDMKTGSDTVRLAVANIIESRKKERKDELNFDIDAFINHNEMLSRRELILKKIDSLRPEYEELALSHKQLISNKNAEDALMQYAMMLDCRINQESQIFEQEEIQLTLQREKVRFAKKACDDIFDKQKILQGEINTLSRSQKKLDDIVNKTTLIVNQYDENETIESIASGHREHLAEKEQVLVLKQDAEQLQTELEALEQEVEKHEEMEARYLTSVNAQEYKLFNQLPESTWMKLAAVNPEVAESNPERLLTVSEQQAIESFTDLFEEKGQHYTLWGLELNPIQVENRESDQIRLSKVQETLRCKRKRMLELVAMNGQSRFERVKDISALEAEIKRTQNTIMRDVIRTMDESGEPYVREASFISRLHRYIQGQSKEKQKQLRTAFSTDNLLASHILVDKDGFGGESRLIFDRAVIGVFRLFDRSLFQDLTDVALKIQLGGIRLLLEKLQSSSMLYSDSDLDFKELIDELFHQLSELLNSIRLNLVKMQTINQELSDASELAAKSHNQKVFSALQQESIEKISLLLSRHILPTRQFLDEKSRLKDGPNLFECLQSLRSQFDHHQDHQRANAMLRYEVSFNSFHKQISKVSQSVDQFLARSKKRLQQFNAIEGAFSELVNELDATKQNLKRSQIDGQFARDNGSFMGLMQQARPKVLRISSSEAYLNNVVSDIEARVVDRSLLEQNRYVDLVSVKDDSTEQRLARAEQIIELVKDMKMAEYQDLTLSLHRRLKDYFSDYHFVDLLEGLNFILRSEAMLDGHTLKMTNFRQRLTQGDNIYLYRKIRTERALQ